MGYLGVPFTLSYSARNYRSGLTNVIALVIKPNGSIAGPYQMSEAAAPFGGRYYAQFLTSTSDPEGEYLAEIFSPSESPNPSPLRVPLYLRPDLSAQITQLQQSVTALTADIAAFQVTAGQIAPGITAIQGFVQVLPKILAANLPKEVEGIVIDGGPMAAEVDAEGITGQVLGIDPPAGGIYSDAILGKTFDDMILLGDVHSEELSGNVPDLSATEGEVEC